tara:strand:+ start:53 stop:226 length:174 start_codon:yes stop_codon:yes gene_type:complete
MLAGEHIHFINHPHLDDEGVVLVGLGEFKLVLALGHAFTSNESQNDLKSDVKMEDLL